MGSSSRTAELLRLDTDHSSRVPLKVTPPTVWSAKFKGSPVPFCSRTFAITSPTTRFGPFDHFKLAGWEVRPDASKVGDGR